MGHEPGYSAQHATGKGTSPPAVHFLFYRRVGPLASEILFSGRDGSMCDSNDLIIAEGRLADFNKIITLAIDNWDINGPVSELKSIVSTACYIIGFLVKEISQIVDGMEMESFAKRPTN